ncbi:MAG: SBBP repeat-containing protein [Gammaproteobacteria bacterium]|nr:SBBP repeat-containing protein [Gammaproteobacteria bacterium]
MVRSLANNFLCLSHHLALPKIAGIVLLMVTCGNFSVAAPVVVSDSDNANSTHTFTNSVVNRPVNSRRIHNSQKMPLHFEKNNGQHESLFYFIAQTTLSQFAFSKDRVTIQLNDKANGNKKQFSLIFENSNDSVIVQGVNKSNYKINYYRGEKSQWRANVSTYSEILYSNIYPDIDLKFYFNETRLEYDFIVKEGADVSLIRFKYDNIDDIKISDENKLDIAVSNGLVYQKAPVIYQLINGKRKNVSGNYVQVQDSFQFNVNEYDKSIALVIDPVIEFSSYFGGDWEDNASTVATDSAGNIFLAGSTSARARITVDNILTLENKSLTPLQDINTVNTYDGTHGISLDNEFSDGSRIDLDNGKKIPVVNGVEQPAVPFEYACDYTYAGFFNRDSLPTDYDGFISKFDKNYVPIYTTFYGGCRNDGIRDLVIDSSDNVYVAGFTLSDNIPSQSAYQVAIAPSRFASEPRQSDAFYAKFNNDGLLIYSSYLGGDGRDGARGIAVDDSGFLYITGYTHSTDLRKCPLSGNTVIGCESIGGTELVTETVDGPEVSLYSDAFVAKVAPTGNAMDFITYFGGRYDDWGQSIALHNDSIYISGNTSSPDLPTLSTGYSFLNYRANDRLCSRVTGSEDYTIPPSDAHFCEDVYLAKISINGEELKYSTYLGGDQDDNVSDMAVDHLGNVYLMGTTRSKGARLEKPKLAYPDDTSEDRALIATILEERFPLYKNINKFVFDSESSSSMTFLTVFNIDDAVGAPMVNPEPVADQLLISTFIGGAGDDSGLAIALNDDPASPEIDVYIAGHTLSDNFFTKSAFQNKTNNSDLYVVKLNLHTLLRNEIYDVNPDGNCSADKCDLYDIEYSTLLGGENLDALKGMHYSNLPGGAGGLFLAGTTYSKLFPVTPNAVKSLIEETKITEYNPLTRNVEFQEPYYPSDMFLVKLSDTADDGDLKFTARVTNADEIREGDQINYEVIVSNDSALVVAKSVRVNLSFAYLASNETIQNYVNISNIEKCELEYKQIFCVIGDIDVAQSKTITISLRPKITGDFPVVFSLMSMTQNSDPNMASNQIVVPSHIRVKPNRGSTDYLTLVILWLFLFGSGLRRCFWTGLFSYLRPGSRTVLRTVLRAVLKSVSRAVSRPKPSTG